MMKQTQLIAIISLALVHFEIVACSSDNSADDGSGGQSSGGSASGGTSSTNVGGAGGQSKGGTTSASTGGSGGQSKGGTTSGGTTSTSACEPAGTISVTNLGSTAYVIDGVNNPKLTLCRNRSYTFDVDATGHPFYIKSVQTTGTGNAYSNGVNGNGTTTGIVTFNVPTSAPNTLYYICSIHSAMTGTLHIVD